MTRFSRAEVDAALLRSKSDVIVSHGQYVLACEVWALRNRVDELTRQLHDAREELEVAKAAECHCWGQP